VFSAILLELEARLQRGLGDLQLRRVGISGCQAVLELVARPGQRASDRVIGVADHPREELGRQGEGGDCRGDPRKPA
jgi:hypothetical protein